jgi:hypothetical protein
MNTKGDELPVATGCAQPPLTQADLQELIRGLKAKRVEMDGVILAVEKLAAFQTMDSVKRRD